MHRSPEKSLHREPRPADTGHMGFTDVSNRLWQERRLLELLQFKLEEEYLVLASGRHGWLARATAEVEQVVETLKSADVERAMAVAGVAEELNLNPLPTLSQLADASPSPWDDILRAHRDILLSLFERIEQVSTRNRELLARGVSATSATLALLGEHPGTAYGADGAPTTHRASARLVNSSL